MTLPQFRKKYLGTQVEYHSFDPNAKYQCVDLVNQYIDEVLRLSPIIGTNAKDFPKNYNKEDFEYIKNTPTALPKAGDIMIWNGRAGGGYGHVAIFLNGDLNRFNSLDQNFSALRVTDENHTYTNVSGWLRSKLVVDAEVSIDKALPENVFNSVIELITLEQLGRVTRKDSIDTILGKYIEDIRAWDTQEKKYKKTQSDQQARIDNLVNEKPKEVKEMIVNKDALKESLKEIGRVALFAFIGFAISYFGNLPETQTTAIVLVALRWLDKYIHENYTDGDQFKGIAPF